MEIFRKQSEKLVFDVSFHVLALWGIKPYDVSSSLSLAGGWVINILWYPSIFALAHRHLVFNDGFVKFRLVAQKLKKAVAEHR